MSTIVGIIVVAAVPVALALFVIGLVALAGLMTYDVVAARRDRPVAPETAAEPAFDHEAAETRIYLQRWIARGFVIAGGTFWGIAGFAGLYWFTRERVIWAFVAAAIPSLFAAATLVVGWYWERIASAALALASAAAVVWGVRMGFEPGVWALVVLALIGPMMTASVLFWLARRDQEALELVLSARPALAPASE